MIKVDCKEQSEKYEKAEDVDKRVCETFLGTLMPTMCITMNKQVGAVTVNDCEFGVRQPILLSRKTALFWMKANKENKSTPPRDAPPPTPITKGINLSATPIVKKEKRQISSRYNVSKNCELTPLPPLNERQQRLEPFNMHFRSTIF
uniref:Uncharacterized protein n=1 Tax=Glossina austeni TaxID=7395 RepID=A0A1A9VFN4_GLOAU